MQIQILSGIYTDAMGDVRTSYPVNYHVVPKVSGVSNGYIRPADGIVQNGTAQGVDRGAINWNGTCYRVSGTKLISVASNGDVTVLGDVGSGGFVKFDYSFDRLAIASGGRLYYWNGTLTQVTDPDLGYVVDVFWIDGYFMFTDGVNLGVTELNDPLSVNPLKYGSSEVDPDPVKAGLELRNEAYAINRYTIEVFDNVGGDLFPFSRIDGAQIQKGSIGTHSCCVFSNSIAFLGSGRNESPSIYMAANATAQKISTQEIDDILKTYSELQLSEVKLEARADSSHQYLYIHLPDRTLVYDGSASAAMEQAIWVTLTTAQAGFKQYRAINFVWCYDKWLCGDTQSTNIGYLDSVISSHWGEIVRWEFGTMMAYNEGRGAIVKQLELVALTGRVALGVDPMISTSYSVDGMSWSQDRAIRTGTTGNAAKRLLWLQQGIMKQWRIQRFTGDSQSHLSMLRLEAELEALAW